MVQHTNSKDRPSAKKSHSPDYPMSDGEELGKAVRAQKRKKGPLILNDERIDEMAILWEYSKEDLE